jgi:hypothetical protein
METPETLISTYNQTIAMLFTLYEGLTNSFSINLMLVLGPKR